MSDVESSPVLATVLGRFDTLTVTGTVLPHEHLVLDLRTAEDPEGYLDHEREVAAELAAARADHGLDLVVDQTARGMGRDAGALARISRASGVAVVAATGWYYGRFHPDGEPGTDVGEATDALLADLLEGIDDSGVRAGIVAEIGTHGERPSLAEEVSLRAAARAATRAGVALGTHAHLGTGAPAQLEILLAEGMDPTRVAIGHQDLSEDQSTQEALLTAGCYLAFDTVGKTSYRSDDDRLARVLELLERGHGERLLLSNDISRHAYLTSEGGQGYRHVLGEFGASLRDAGVGEDAMDLLFRRNALRWLAGAEA